MPIAIKLQNTPEAGTKEVEYPIWTPKDKEHEWLYAKLWVKMADAQMHHVVSRHLHCIIVMETFAMATYRTLATIHPVYKILHPHLQHVIAVNVLDRQQLSPGNEGMFEKFLAVGDQYEKLLKQAFKSFSLDNLHLPTDLEERGVGDGTALPNYLYRDDSIQLWNIIKKFIRTMLYLHYWDDSCVQADDELQSWISDIHGNGFQGKGVEKHGIPDKLNSLDQLIELVTIIVFTASCRTSALTSGK